MNVVNKKWDQFKTHRAGFSTAILSLAMLAGISAYAAPAVKTYSQTTQLPDGLHTPDVVETSIGTLNFMDGAPLPETAELVYENLDRMRGVDVFLKMHVCSLSKTAFVGA